MSFPPLLNGPIPPYSNLPIEAFNYLPSQFYISNIQLGQTTIVTTTLNTNYVIGQLVRLLIPFFSGCRELNEVEGYVISLPSLNEVELAIDSTTVSIFTSSTSIQQPQIVAVGGINSGNIIPNTFIPGSFINIST
jgi:hypothetical protein